MDIVEINKKLIGATSWCGESNIDRKVNEHLKNEVAQLTGYVCDILFDNLSTGYDNNASAEMIRKTAKEIILSEFINRLDEDTMKKLGYKPLKSLEED